MEAEIIFYVHLLELCATICCPDTAWDWFQLVCLLFPWNEGPDILQNHSIGAAIIFRNCVSSISKKPMNQQFIFDASASILSTSTVY